MAAFITLIFVIAISMVLTKIGRIALVHTGLTKEQALFQSISAFTGSGYTTGEAEPVMRHPVLRRVVTMRILGSVGLATEDSELEADSSHVPGCRVRILC